MPCLVNNYQCARTNPKRTWPVAIVGWPMWPYVIKHFLRADSIFSLLRDRKKPAQSDSSSEWLSIELVMGI